MRTWQARLAEAQRTQRAGDVLVLADEAPTPALWLEGRRAAGSSLLALQQPAFALEQVDAALAVEPNDLVSRSQRSVCLARLASLTRLARLTHATSSRRLDAKPPRQVLLFTGHMVDAPDRPTPRFPASKRGAAEQAIERVLDTLGAGPDDIALTQGAAGGDLLFGHSCLERGVQLQLLLPLAEPQFIEASVLPSADGSAWAQAFAHVKSRLAQPPREMPVALGPTARDTSPFERCNRWLLNTALAHGPDKLRLVCLWDGGGADGPGGTRHLVDEAKRRTGHVHWVDVRSL